MKKFFTSLSVYGCVENLTISENAISSTSPFSVIPKEDELEVYEKKLVDPKSELKRVCNLPKNTSVSLLSIFAAGSCTITEVSVGAVNNNASPFFLTLINGAKLRCGLPCPKIYCRLESGATIDAFITHESVVCRWAVEVFHASLQHGCTIKGISVLKDAKFVLTRSNHQRRITTGDIVIKPDTKIGYVPNGAFLLIDDFSVVIEGTSPAAAAVAPTLQAKLTVSKKRVLEEILTVCMPPPQPHATAVTSTGVAIAMPSYDAVIQPSSGLCFYRVRYFHNNRYHTLTTHTMPPTLPPDSTITEIVPLGSNPLLDNDELYEIEGGRLLTRREYLLYCHTRKKRQRARQRVVDNARLQAAIDESFEMTSAASTVNGDNSDERLDLTGSFVISEEFKRTNKPFFLLKGNVDGKDVEACVDECSICRVNEAVVGLSCGQYAFCIACAKTSMYLTDKCPLCNNTIEYATAYYSKNNLVSASEVKNGEGARIQE